MKVVVGSKNKEKIKIVKDALTELRLEVEVEGVEADSGIAGQPLDKKATKKGAINRARNAKKTNPNADFWVGLEGAYTCLISKAWPNQDSVDKSGQVFIGEGEENLAVQNAYANYLKDSGQLGYRNKVSGVVIDKKGKYLIVQLTTYSEGHWNFSGGGIEKGEMPEETILRELKEELGTNKFTILKHSSIKHKYDYPPQAIAKRLRDEGRTWLGQEVTYFQLLFTGNKSDINPDPVEIRYVKWVDYKDLESHFIIPKQWEVTKRVIGDF